MQADPALAEAAGPESETTALRGRCVVMLGAGRSGTSVLAAGLQALGVELGERLRGGAAKNPLGHFEDTDTVRLNRALRRLLVGRRQAALVPETRWSAPALMQLENQAVETLQTRFGDHALWGIKNNGTLRFLPFWQRVIGRLGHAPVYVAALRDPWSAAQSRHHSPRDKPSRVAKTLEGGVHKWLVSWVPYFPLLRHEQVVVVDYARLLADPEGQLLRLARALGLPLDQALRDRISMFANTFLDPGLRHHHPRPDALLSLPGGPLANHVYGWLDRLAADEIGMHDAELWAAWGELEAQLRPLTPAAGAPQKPRPRWQRRIRKLWRHMRRFVVAAVTSKPLVSIAASGGLGNVC